VEGEDAGPSCFKTITFVSGFDSKGVPTGRPTP